MKTTIGQIYLTHPKDENFTTVYEESLNQHNQAVDLFAVVDIEGSSGNQLKKDDREEYEKVAQHLVTAFKKAYISTETVTTETFENALASINSSLSSLARKGNVRWFKKLNVALAARHKNTLSLSVTGNARVYLGRDDELTLLSEDLPDEKKQAVKIFSNYSTGGLTAGDRILLSTNQLFNFLSLERISEFINDEETVGDSCREIIEALQDIKTTGFAAFVVETGDSSKKVIHAATSPISWLGQKTNQKPKKGASYIRVIQMIGATLMAWLGALFNALMKLFSAIYIFFKDRPKKYLISVLVAVLIVLVGLIAFGFAKKAQQDKEQAITQDLTQLEEILNQAEATQIYNDEGRTLELLNTAEELFARLDPALVPEEQYNSFTERIQALVAKIKKELVIPEPTTLTEFPTNPNDLIFSPNGFLGFNSDSSTIAFYDFRTGQSTRVAADQNTSQLEQGIFLTPANQFIFFNKSGSFTTLLLDDETLNPFGNEDARLNADDAHIQSAKLFGTDASPRLYMLDTRQNQIHRFTTSASDIGSAVSWIQGEADLSSAQDIAIDGSIYILFPDRLEQYFNGRRQNFALTSLVEPLSGAVSIFTSDTHTNLYIADPAGQRVLIFDKNGNFVLQVTSDAFADLTDLYVDEQNKIIYALSGNRLLQVNY